MRNPPAGRVATSVLCAALLLGAAAPTALAAGSASGRTRASSPVPEAQQLLERAESLGGVGEVLQPVSGLVEAVLKADNGRLGAAEAEELGEDVREAIAEAIAAAAANTPAAPAPPAAPSASEAPAAPTTPEVSASTLPAPLPPVAPAEPMATASTLPAPAEQAKAPAERAKAPQELRGGFGDLQRAVDALLAATSGDPSEVLSAVDAVLDVVVELVTSVVGGSGLPVEAPDVSAPTDASAALPVDPITSLPADPAVTLPAADPAEPVSPLPAGPAVAAPSDPADVDPAAAVPAAAVQTARTLPTAAGSVPSP